MKLFVANDNEPDEGRYLVCRECEGAHYLVRNLNGFDWIICAGCGQDMTEMVFRDIARG